jgi:Cellulase (glycosyl hydrolase family 5)
VSHRALRHVVLVLVAATGALRVGASDPVTSPASAQTPFLMGANYVPSHDWHTTLEHWDASAVDADLAALSGLGVKCVRVFPLWPLLQPEPDRLDAVKLDRLVSLLDMAHRHGLVVQVSPLTGWMSGLAFLPRWADGNIFTDERIVAGEEHLVRGLASRLRGHPALASWDFGNEINVLVERMKLQVTPAETDAWMQRIYRAFKEADPDTPVTNGIGTGFDPRFNTRAIARSVDFLSVHSYPQFHRTNLLDPPLGMRTTYSVNFVTAWAMAEGKPVLMQETGASEDQATPRDVASYLRLTLASTWAEGASGYFWWCSHDIEPAYRVAIDGFFPKYSLASQADGRLGPMEQSLGLLTVDNREKASAAEYGRLAALLAILGAGWEDRLPVVYVLAPATDDYFRAMLELIEPFVLLKRAHAKVRILHDGAPVPPDAAAVVIAGFSPTPAGRDRVGEYLESGGTVYQSVENDFAPAVRVGPLEDLPDARLWLERGGGRVSAHRFLTLPSRRVRPVSVAGDVDVLGLLARTPPEAGTWSFGQPIFVRARVGRGRFFYLGADLEAGLLARYDPWTGDQSHLLYEALLPAAEVDVDNPAVELAHKVRGDEELLVLVNHSEQWQDVVVSSGRPLRLEDVESAVTLGQGRSVSLRLAPAQVTFARALDR